MNDSENTYFCLVIKVTHAVNYNKETNNKKLLFAVIEMLTKKKKGFFFHKLQKNAFWKRTDGNVVESQWKWNQTEKQAGGS